MIHSAQGESSSCQRKFLLQPFYFFGEPLCWFPDHAHSAVAPVFHQCTGGKLLVNSGWTKNFSTASHAPSITSRIALCWRSGPQFRPTSLLRCIDSQWTLFDIQCSEEAHPVVRVLTGQLFRPKPFRKRNHQVITGFALFCGTQIPRKGSQGSARTKLRRTLSCRMCESGSQNLPRHSPDNAQGEIWGPRPVLSQVFLAMCRLMLD